MNTPRALVIGLGNVLMGDDAFGPSVVEAMHSAFDFPPGVTVLDGGTPGLNLMPLMMDYDILIVVDTVKTKGNPGEMRLYRKADLSPAARSPRQGPHEPGLDEVLTALDLAGRGPSEVLLIGVIPESVATGTGMSAPLSAAIPLAIREVQSELSRYNLAPLSKPQPAASAPWWSRGAGVQRAMPAFKPACRSNHSSH
jgi:hydrogenase maturation protease